MSLIQMLIETSHWSLFILIIGFISSGLALLYFKSALAFILQLILIAGLIGLSYSFAAVVIISVIQIVYSLFLVYRLMQAIHYSYMLVLEKTKQVPTNITQKDSGVRSNFL